MLVLPLGQKVISLTGIVKDQVTTMKLSTKQRQPADIIGISAAIHHGCMGLPQQLVEYIMEVLRDDLQTLKACSLTCKPMFAST